MRKLWLFRLVLLVLTFATAAHGQFSVLYYFGTNADDPLNGSGIVAQGRDGNLYGTGFDGGQFGFGAVFKITQAGAVTTLYSFSGLDGAYPEGGLTLATDGYFYGTTGSSLAEGTLFKITPGGKLTTLHTFTGTSDGGEPEAPPIQATDGNFYGTTTGDGTHSYGTVYKLTPSRTFTTLYQFDITHGAGPVAPLVQGTDGNLYGTTPYGGSDTYGVVFKITTAGKLTVLHNFSDNPDGATPDGGLVQGSDGNFYGTTFRGGTHGFGAIFKMTPAGELTILYSISYNQGGYPTAGLVQASDGNFYGANTNGVDNGYGELFRITPNGTFSILYNFDGATGSDPESPLLQHTKGVLYGNALCGGTLGPDLYCSPEETNGVFYKLAAKLKPFVTLLPYSGKVGTTIEFLGQNFTSATTVSFNGIPATVTVKSSTYLTAVVPSGATSGFVQVTTSKGTLTSNKKFQVIP
jgi:uncharacterized repeat protein (TIGR03803 family)